MNGVAALDEEPALSRCGSRQSIVAKRVQLPSRCDSIGDKRKKVGRSEVPRWIPLTGLPPKIWLRTWCAPVRYLQVSYDDPLEWESNFLGHHQNQRVFVNGM